MTPPEAPGGAAHEVTGLLRAWREGEVRAGDELLARIYDELKKIAAAQLRGESGGHTLQPTALVNEAYMRLLPQRGVAWRDRTHFFGLAATMMRRVLVDHARARNARKRGGAAPLLVLTITSNRAPAVELIDLDRVLSALAERFPRQAKVVEMRYFADLEIEEIATCLAISPATVKRDWLFARAWLNAALDPAPGSAPERAP